MSTVRREIKRAWVALALPLLSPVKYAAAIADARLDRAMTCPECGHGAEPDPEIRAEQADGCDCTDDLCACYVESDRVPCGMPDANCGLRGGGAHCGGCRD